MYLYPISNSKETQFQNSKKKKLHIFSKKNEKCTYMIIVYYLKKI